MKSLFLFFQPFKILKKKILGSWTIQKQVAGWIWHVHHSVLTPALNHGSQMGTHQNPLCNLLKTEMPKPYRMTVSGGGSQGCISFNIP